MHKGRSHYVTQCVPGSRTSSVVDPSAVTIHRNANLHARKDPLPAYPLAKEQAAERKRPRKPPQHTRKDSTAEVAAT